ncbi:MAG: hypothetical protein ACJAVU_002984 [Cognaticolwellia sp.]|jgi:hypothetical protein
MSVINIVFEGSNSDILFCITFQPLTNNVYNKCKKAAAFITLFITALLSTYLIC